MSLTNAVTTAIVVGLTSFHGQVHAGSETKVVASDPCLDQLLPMRSLLRALRKEFPTWLPPLAFDNSPEDIALNKSQGGNGCLGVASGDFDGNGEKDVVLALVSAKISKPNVVIALSQEGTWQFRPVESGVDTRNRLYTQSVPAGRYNRTRVLNSALEPGEADPLTCEHPGVLVGALESTGIVYCQVGNHWQHVWVSD